MVSTALTVALTCGAFLAGRGYQWYRDARQAMGYRKNGRSKK
jgi:hypothetical protein